MKSTNDYYGQAASYTGGGGYGPSGGGYGQFSGGGGGTFGNSPLYNHPPPRSPFSGPGGYSQQYSQQQYPQQGLHNAHVLLYNMVHSNHTSQPMYA